jgi:hypothetical protein
MRDQVSAGISVHYVSEDRLKGTKYEAEDFVIYDGVAARVARLTDKNDPKTPYEDKVAVLKLSTEVSAYVDKFDYILRQATEFMPHASKAAEL